MRGHFHRQLIVKFHASALAVQVTVMLIIFIERLFRSGRIQRPLLPLQRTFRGHRSRYLALGKERSQMEKWVRAFFTQLLRWHVHTRRPPAGEHVDAHGAGWHRRRSCQVSVMRAGGVAIVQLCHVTLLQPRRRSTAQPCAGQARTCNLLPWGQQRPSLRLVRQLA